MKSVVVIAAAGLVLGIGAFVAAEPPAAPATPAPSTVKPALAPETTPAPKADAPAATYPAYATKKLWAAVDLRGKRAPQLNVEEWRGGKAPEMKGKTLLVDFWGIGCPPCRALIPELEGFQEKYKDDLLVIGLTSDAPKKVAEFEDFRGGKIKYTTAHDSQLRAFKEVGVEGIPHVLIISSDGIVRWQGFPQSSEEPLTEKVLKQIIDADKAVRAKSAPADTKKLAEQPAPKSDTQPKKN